MGCTLMERPASSSSEGKVLEGPGRRAGRHTSISARSSSSKVTILSVLGKRPRKRRERILFQGRDPHSRVARRGRPLSWVRLIFFRRKPERKLHYSPGALPAGPLVLCLAVV